MKKLLSRALVPVAAVAVIASTAPTAQAASFVPCDTTKPTRVCYDEIRPTAFGTPLRQVAGDTPLANVAAYYDVYNIPFGTGGVQIPCITPVVNGVAVDNCARLGFELVERIVLVDETEAGLLKLEVHGSVYVCEAELTVLVNNVGLNRFPILSVCHDDLPEFST